MYFWHYVCANTCTTVYHIQDASKGKINNVPAVNTDTAYPKVDEQEAELLAALDEESEY